MKIIIQVAVASGLCTFLIPTVAAQGTVTSSVQMPAKMGVNTGPPTQIPRTFTQTDWSGGQVFQPTSNWQAGFASADVSWRSIPGQLALSSVPLGTPVKEIVSDTFKVPHGMTSADLNGDGLVEMITARAVSSVFPPLGALYWWVREAPGQWSERVISDDFYGASDVVTGDMDGDGDLDVIASAAYGTPDNHNGRYSWFENINGDGLTWTEHSIGQLFWGPHDVEVADFDGDGDLDVFGCTALTFQGSGAPDVYWFENIDQGAGWAFHLVESDWSAAESIEVADFDGDGDLDICANSYGVPDNVCVWFNLDGAGTTGPREVVEQVAPFYNKLEAVDLHGNGVVDILGASLHSTPPTFWENTNGDGLTWARKPIGVPTNLGWTDIKALDLDGDGDLDVVAAANGGLSHRMTWWENTGQDAQLWPAHVISIGDPGDRPDVDAGDIDGDGQLEILACSQGANNQHIFTYRIVEFRPSGSLTSQLLNGGAIGNWDKFTWDASQPVGTTFGISVRVGNSPMALGPWVLVPNSGTQLGTLVNSGARYLQYRVNFQSTSGTLSPILREVSVTRG